MKKIIPVPPGRGAGNSYLAGGIISTMTMVLMSVGFNLRLEAAIERLYTVYSVTHSGKTTYFVQQKVLIDGMMIPEIEDVFGNCFIGFWLMIVAAILSVTLNYLYFTGETKPIYLMKRLPDRSAMHRMCLSGPILMLIAGIAIMLMIAYADYRVYLLKPPAECIPDTKIDSIIEFLLGTIV